MGQFGRDVGCVHIGATERHDPVLDVLDLGKQIAAQSPGLLDRHGLEPDFRADRQPPERREIGGNDGRDLGVSAGGLAVGQKNDRLSVAGHLYGARRNGVGCYVVAARMGDVPAFEPMPIRLEPGPTVYSLAKNAASSDGAK
jgi:hypothetical protein